MIYLPSVGNPDEVTVQDMKKALDNPSLGIKVIDVRKAEFVRFDQLLLLDVVGHGFAETKNFPNLWTKQK